MVISSSYTATMTRDVNEGCALILTIKFSISCAEYSYANWNIPYVLHRENKQLLYPVIELTTLGFNSPPTWTPIVLSFA